MKNKLLFTSLVTLISLLYIYTLAILYNNLKINNKILIQSSLEKAIEIEKDMRLKKINTPIWISSVPKDTAEDTTHKYENRPIIRFKQSDEANKIGQTEILNHVLQTFLHIENPVNVNVLDSIFNHELQREALIAQTAILYIDNISGKNITNRTDSIFFRSVYTTDTLNYGIRKEVSFIGYAKIPIFYIINQVKYQILGISFIWLSTFIFLSLWGFSIKKSQNKLFAEINRSNIDISCETLQLITKELFLDKDLCLLIKNDRKIKLTSQSVQIIELLLSNTDYYLSYDELIFKLWGKVECKGQERLTQSIKRLRESLKWCPEITIENIRKEGYRLVIKSE
ncbi:hypothetical protein SDC9_56104 [bioreactor metagenome]|uniref:OmpR/PhoB-type domain-containing protein n=1 Tax=bioreactor metagenome TaxID=1076179 RepID=A0A644X1M4_9ZZZZ